MKILYNDIDPKACAWMRELIADGQIPHGDVVCKSITDITPDEIKDYQTQHYFAGIAGWPAAFELAGWPAGRPVISASLPCQSFSAAGKGKGFGDHRGQLWYPFLELVKVARPQLIFGEQVAAAIGKGWLDRVFDDLEKENYTCGAVVLGAHSVGAPHCRQRIYWVASLGDAEGGGLGELRPAEAGHGGRHTHRNGWLGDARSGGRNTGVERDLPRQEGARSKHRTKPDRSGQFDLLADSLGAGLEGHAWYGDGGGESGRQRAQANGPAAEGGAGMDNADGTRCSGEIGNAEADPREETRLRLPSAGCFWSDYEIIHFKDGSQRRIKRGLKPMAPGLPRGLVPGSRKGLAINANATAEARRMRLHGYGNAVNLPLATAFIETIMEEFNITPTNK